MQHIGYESGINTFANTELKRLIAQLFPGNDFLCQCIGIGNHTQSLLPFLQTTENLGTKYLICRIFLSVFDSATERRRKKQYPLPSQYLRKVMIEISRFFKIAQDKNKRTGLFPHQYRKEKRSGRCTQSPTKNMFYGNIFQQPVHGRHIGMDGILLLQFSDSHYSCFF